MSVRRGLSVLAGVVTLRAVRAGLVRGFVTVTHTYVHAERAGTTPVPAATGVASPRSPSRDSHV